LNPQLQLSANRGDLKLKKLISNDEKLISMVNKVIKKSELMKHITNIQLRQDTEDKSIYYVLIEVRYGDKEKAATTGC
jgi:hypothetical protein